jgi:hypothetical protein
MYFSILQVLQLLFETVYQRYKQLGSNVAICPLHQAFSCLTWSSLPAIADCQSCKTLCHFAVAIMSKMGAGRLGKGRQFMPPLPKSWASLKDHVVTQQAQQARFARPDPTAPSKGTSGKAQKPSRPSSKGTVKEASSKGTVKEAGMPARLGRTDSDAMPDMPHAPLQQQASLSISGQTAAPLKPVSSTVKGPGEKARGTANGEHKPAWGAAQPAPNATQVAAARSYKV